MKNPSISDINILNLLFVLLNMMVSKCEAIHGTNNQSVETCSMVHDNTVRFQSVSIYFEKTPFFNLSISQQIT